jgi:hypothetical protein
MSGGLAASGQTHLSRRIGELHISKSRHAALFRGSNDGYLLAIPFQFFSQPRSERLTRTEYLLASPLPTILEIGFPNLLGAKKLDFESPSSECESPLPLSGPECDGRKSPCSQAHQKFHKAARPLQNMLASAPQRDAPDHSGHEKHYIKKYRLVLDEKGSSCSTLLVFKLVRYL